MENCMKVFISDETLYRLFHGADSEHNKKFFKELMKDSAAADVPNWVVDMLYDDIDCIQDEEHKVWTEPRNPYEFIDISVDVPAKMRIYFKKDKEEDELEKKEDDCSKKKMREEKARLTGILCKIQRAIYDMNLNGASEEVLRTFLKNTAQGCERAQEAVDSLYREGIKNKEE